MLCLTESITEPVVLHGITITVHYPCEVAGTV